jgi:hypothetical protein
MNIDEQVIKICEQITGYIDSNENCITWDDEVKINSYIVEKNNLQSIFDNTDELENMYTYEMFDSPLLTMQIKKNMVDSWIFALKNIVNIQISI